MVLTECNSQINPQGRELVTHGTVLFPIACHYVSLVQWPVSWHWHDEMEAVFVSEGKALVSVGAEKFTVCQGNGFFVNSGVLHAAWDVENSDCKFHSLVFHPRLIGGSLDSVFWQNYLMPLMASPILKGIHFDGSEKWKQEANEAIERAWQICTSEQPGYEFNVRHELSHLIYLLYSFLPVAQNRPSEKALRDGERIKVMLQYIQDHFAEDLVTAQIAASAMISESECLRCFHSTISITPIQYLKQFRIQKAAELLDTTKQKIGDIAIQCGFQEMSYFAKAFREVKKCTPTEYRNQRTTLNNKPIQIFNNAQ